VLCTTLCTSIVVDNVTSCFQIIAEIQIQANGKLFTEQVAPGAKSSIVGCLVLDCLPLFESSKILISDLVPEH